MGRAMGILAAAIALAVPSWSPSAGAGVTDGFASDNVEFVKHIPFEAGTATGARLVGDHLYVTSYKSLSIYDISDPLEPVRVGFTPVLVYMQNEDVDTDGDILLFSDELPRDTLHVFDVEDPTTPVEVGSLPLAGDHTLTCVRDCEFAYGSDGAVVSLKDPSAPKLMGDWATDLPEQRGFGVHDVTEVRPGLVITSSDPVMVLNTKGDLRRPRVVALGTASLPGLFHSSDWPRAGKDRFLLLATEGGTTAGACDSTAGVFSVWETDGWRRQRTVSLVDSFRMSNGTHADGKALPGIGCSAHWFDARGDFHNGGFVVLAGYKQGTRFLEVDPDGSIAEVGYFLGHGADASAAYWVTDEVVYSIDLNRGIDILRFHAS
ncbi:MAG: LVIVD repeat-containing protein [Actinomycetota bacterium]